MANGLSIAGRKEYTANDFYETPAYATAALLAVEEFKGRVLEPACGLGAISRVCERHYPVVSSDIEPLGYGQVQDFYKVDRQYDNIITNPPYNQAQRFIEHAKQVATKKIAMLLKLTFLESAKRAELFADKEFPLASIYVFRSRVTMHPYGMKPKNSGTITYAWYVWDKAHTGSPVIKWI